MLENINILKDFKEGQCFIICNDDALYVEESTLLRQYLDTACEGDYEPQRTDVPVKYESEIAYWIEDETIRYENPNKLSEEKTKVNFIDLQDILFAKKLKNFSNHKWVKYYIDLEGEPNIQFAEGCHYNGKEDLEKFEENVLDKYGKNKNSIQYKTYMLIADTLRLKLNLSYRTTGTVIKVCNFNQILKEQHCVISNFIEDSISQFKSTEDKYYVPKNVMWLMYSQIDEQQEFKYLKNSNTSQEDNYYYDLITLNYLDNNFAIPVPILAKILQVTEEDLYNCFTEEKMEYKDEVDFI
ncbi:MULTISPECIES: hypothetical protein [unclassified Clostridium]|uniref:hypothetical protein n=1 Tax=unclassified Clostridium TaxID=2614128 RepID=UPI0025C52A29|nr:MULTISPECIES: hypothetical protein [unclassified Clostridium]